MFATSDVIACFPSSTNHSFRICQLTALIPQSTGNVNGHTLVSLLRQLFKKTQIENIIVTDQFIANQPKMEGTIPVNDSPYKHNMEI